jgi:2-oxoglutarate dehydrogenase E2 component (dihydrolipoamide succinyltransferase)
MARVELIMPKMGESIIEATILKWVKSVGDKVSAEETIVEIATDKVDSEIPSPVDGVLMEILFKEDSVVPVGQTIAIIATEGSDDHSVPPSSSPAPQSVPSEVEAIVNSVTQAQIVTQPAETPGTSSGRFYSHLVRSIAKEENISQEELDKVPGTGLNNRVTKADIFEYIKTKGQPLSASAPSFEVKTMPQTEITEPVKTASVSGQVEIVEMDRMRRIIAEHMVKSKQVSPHVTSFVESDVTNMVRWREKNKAVFEKKYGTKITFTPLFIEAIVKAIKDFPLINISLEGQNILVKKDINIGIAAALPSGNLIVPVIKNADFLNVAGLAKNVNDLVQRARQNKLKPDEIQGGTFTLTNVGTFGNLMGTPIINQPQVAILATGAIVKKPAVIETEHGDVIAIRHMMFLSMSYDHRIVDGSLGGAFLKKVSDYLEAFDPNTSV